MKKYKLELFCAAMAAPTGNEVESPVLKTFTGKADPKAGLLAIIASDKAIQAAEKEIIGSSPNFYAAILFGRPVQRDTITLRYRLNFN